MNLMKITTQQKIYIISGIFACTALALGAFLLWPLYTDIQNGSGQLTAIKSQRASLDVENNEIANFKKNYNQYQPNLAKLNEAFVDPKNPVNFIAFLESSADSSNIKSTISLIQNPNQDSQNVLTFQLSTSGNFLDTLQFAQQLENGPYLIEIEDVSIQDSSPSATVKKPPLGNVDSVFLLKTIAQP